MANAVMRGYPVDLIKSAYNDGYFLPVDNGFANSSVPHEFTGDTADHVLVAPQPGQRLVVKGVTILGDGNQGKVKIKRGNGVTILPAWFSAQNRAGASGALNVVLNPDEVVTVTATGRGQSETFVGVSYIELY